VRQKLLSGHFSQQCLKEKKGSQKKEMKESMTKNGIKEEKK
jgi:hypothetical protein